MIRSADSEPQETCLGRTCFDAFRSNREKMELRSGASNGGLGLVHGFCANNGGLCRATALQVLMGRRKGNAPFSRWFRHISVSESQHHFAPLCEILAP
jgi:hypothetical protein